ncbi:DUF4188 domain-containing protein [Streptomyces xiaopingdaonensis]|uniref:DUF4188 domain-containing protein n=1 Tax=Streptomyces xiaopingdaonensis TaxID=1565415 RepID=UPI00037CECA7|nr:DUF4188 domain-containing protein [Streptomyces xiaopingdaonensis]
MGAVVEQGRRTTAAEGDVVVFLIGMRINRLRALRHWLPVFKVMPEMLKELSADPSSGLLGARVHLAGPREFVVVQYWESREKLYAYAAAPECGHRPAWTDFNRRARKAEGCVGIWHETYLVPPGRYECVYTDMPRHGLGAAHGTQPVQRRGESAAERLRAGRAGA